MNILFIMCDQLRADYLSCYDHPYIKTKNIDSIASNGVQFSNAYCQAPLCGPSRASFYTGRYMSSHGVMANWDPLKLGELTLGDYLRETGMPATVVGKSEGSPNNMAIDRFDIDITSKTGQLLANNGFLPYEIFSGIYPDSLIPDDLGYSAYLRSHGFDGANPWELWANTAIDPHGREVSGWHMQNAGLPARIPEEYSETAFITDRAIEFIRSQDGDAGWCLHLSYIKPHWPYLAPSPYNKTYHRDHVLKAIRHRSEKAHAHPVYEAFMNLEYSRNFAKDEVRDKVIPTYMGLIQQVDDHIGRVLMELEQQGLNDKTVIVFTSDHGDYLGDHWLGEKDLFHQQSVRIPLIIYDPSSAADITRGRVIDKFVEAIDVLPTLVDIAGGTISEERVEGRSLVPFMHQIKPSWPKEFVVSEIDFSDRGTRALLGLHPYDCRAHSIQTERWKYIFHEKFRPQLFDLDNDPDEFVDLGKDPGYRSVRQDCYDQLFAWHRNLKTRTEVPTDMLFGMGPKQAEERGILIGRW